MRPAFAYAKQQFFDLRFEAFSYQAQGGRRYLWAGGSVSKALCLFFVNSGLDGLAYLVFAAVVKQEA